MTARFEGRARTPIRAAAAKRLAALPSAIRSLWPDPQVSARKRGVYRRDFGSAGSTSFPCPSALSLSVT